MRAKLADVLPAAATRIAIVSQPGIDFDVHTGREHRRFEIGVGEEAKSLASVEELCRAWAAWGLTRLDAVVAVGGGVVTDTVGFAAASYHRGIPIVHVPTTLLGMVDAAVGGKTGVNLPEGKNLVGAFWQPCGVLCDLDALATLPERELRSGRGELAKYHFLTGVDLLSLELDERVAAAVRIKAEVITADEREDPSKTRGRAILNYGHTLAHALETAGRYDLRHGEAVGIGLVYAAELAAGARPDRRRPRGPPPRRRHRLRPRRRAAAGCGRPGPGGADGPGQEGGHRPHVRARQPGGRRGGARCGRVRRAGGAGGDQMSRRIVLLLSGPNLNLLGDREPEVYGTESLDDHVASARMAAEAHDLELEHLQSNHEGELVEAIHGARGRCAAIVINPGAFTHYAWWLHDALAAFDGPVVELHLSNPASRESWRQVSVVAPVASATIAGLGGHGYPVALSAVARMLAV